MTDTYFWTKPYYGVTHLQTEKTGKSIVFGVITVIEYTNGSELHVIGPIGSHIPHIREIHATVDKAKESGLRHAVRMGLLEPEPQTMDAITVDPHNLDEVLNHLSNVRCEYVKLWNHGNVPVKGDPKDDALIKAVSAAEDAIKTMLATIPGTFAEKRCCVQGCPMCDESCADEAAYLTQVMEP